MIEHSLHSVSASVCLWQCLCLKTHSPPLGSFSLTGLKSSLFPLKSLVFWVHKDVSEGKMAGWVSGRAGVIKEMVEGQISLWLKRTITIILVLSHWRREKVKWCGVSWLPSVFLPPMPIHFHLNFNARWIINI